jgi:tetratricopeptide (TPR) repeat protein
MWICIQTGQFERAESEYEAFRRLPLPTRREIYRPGEAERRYCWLRYYQGRLSFEELDQAERIAQKGDRLSVRDLAYLRGVLSLERGQTHQAIAAFEKVIEMSQAVGRGASGNEALLARARAMNGEREQARQICDRLSEMNKPPHIELAEAWLEIGERERAKNHALEGYKWAWAEGPPYSRWWELERCRKVLGKLGEPEPVLPAFDPGTARPLPVEDQIRKAIAKLKEENRKTES